MLTDNLEITRPDYWARVYTGKNDNAKVDASNTVRPKNPFDRFGWVAGYAEGPTTIEVAAGHGHISKRIKAAHPDWSVIATDQTEAAKIVSNYKPYFIIDAYELSEYFGPPRFDTLIIAQALEYIEHQERFLDEAEKVAKKLLLTVPKGNMERWSQLRLYDEENIKKLLEPYGEIEIFQVVGDLMLVKLKFFV